MTFQFFEYSILTVGSLILRRVGTLTPFSKGLNLKTCFIIFFFLRSSWNLTQFLDYGTEATIRTLSFGLLLNWLFLGMDWRMLSIQQPTVRLCFC
ncbi:hypothetical protein RCL_jg2766.t1 [Rhizophagus clarus]|uniref:Uncharacterized protein n=1 Tax=Rhizophagus clarus TaxID=94130 RepID=A0A8H3M825_9GLOM|nr:hypothetical protein RCL_jg2766.t1 [Rhizophagus clarus]